MQLIYKNCGITMNQFILMIKEQNKGRKIAYMGRLDPMARGMVQILFDDECYKMNQYIEAKKIYQVRVIVGLSTDSDDVLGILCNKNIMEYDTCHLNKFFTQNNIMYNQKYHYYSTKQINKRKRNDMSPSTHDVAIFKSHIFDRGTIETKEWVETFIKHINMIDKSKNFRQEEIIRQWEEIPSIIKMIEYIDVELYVSSGFFVRQHIRETMNETGIPLLCYDIHRINMV